METNFNFTTIEDYSPMEWTQEHSLEAPELDRQNKELVSFFNEALNHCSSDKTEEKAFFDKTVESVIVLLAKHFETEEQFLSAGNYDRYDEHKLDHTKLLEKIHYIKDEIQNDRWEMYLLVLTRTLNDWFKHHFDSYDINAREYFRAGNIVLGGAQGGAQTNRTENYFAV
jgi:hemerythrin-like metal-binding protein